MKSNFQWKKQSKLNRTILFIYIACFLFGGLRHWSDILNGGIFPYKNVLFVFNFYLTSLAIIDFIVIILMITQPVYGLVLAIFIMASDLMVDFYVGYKYWHTSLQANLGLQLLLGFGLFVFISAPLFIKRLKLAQA